MCDSPRKIRRAISMATSVPVKGDRLKRNHSESDPESSRSRPVWRKRNFQRRRVPVRKWSGRETHVIKRMSTQNSEEGSPIPPGLSNITRGNRFFTVLATPPITTNRQLHTSFMTERGFWPYTRQSREYFRLGFPRSLSLCPPSLCTFSARSSLSTVRSAFIRAIFQRETPSVCRGNQNPRLLINTRFEKMTFVLLRDVNWVTCFFDTNLSLACVTLFWSFLNSEL